jgi:hypothetical protein
MSIVDPNKDFLSESAMHEPFPIIMTPLLYHDTGTKTQKNSVVSLLSGKGLLSITPQLPTISLSVQYS